MTKKLIIFPALLILITLILPVQANAYTKKAVLSLGAGNSISNSWGSSQNFNANPPDNYTSYNYSASNTNQSSALFNGFVGIEWEIAPRWLLQTGIDYKQVSPFYPKGTVTQGVDQPSSDQYNYQYNLSIKQLLLEGKLLYSIKEKFHPYFLLGLGGSWNSASNFGTNVPLFLTFTRQYQNNTAESFSYNLGIGFDVDLTKHLRLGAGYRFTDYGKVQLGNASINSISTPGSLSQNHFYANELLTQLTIIF